MISDHQLAQMLRRYPDLGEQAMPPHIDDVTLAELVDGALDNNPLDTALAHLASCAKCRNLAFAVALASQDNTAYRSSQSTPGPHPETRRWLRPALALAATLIAAAGALLWLDGKPHKPASPSDISLQLAAALTEDWPRQAALEPFNALAAPDPLRGDSDDWRTPTPLAPRWSRTILRRPTLRWWIDSTQKPSQLELLLLDQDELPVAVFSPPIHGGGEQTFDYPADLSPLEPDRVYLWKISAKIGGEWISSPWVPFVVLSDNAVARLSSDSEQHALLAAVDLAQSGLYEQALARLAAIEGTTEGSERKRLTRKILLHRRLPQRLLDRELDRELRR